MITQFKIYENNTEPQVGDYVMVNHDCANLGELQDFFKTAIGQLVEISNFYYVDFGDIPTDVGAYLHSKEPFHRINMIIWGKSKKEVELIAQANKFNL